MAVRCSELISVVVVVPAGMISRLIPFRTIASGPISVVRKGDLFQGHSTVQTIFRPCPRVSCVHLKEMNTLEAEIYQTSGAQEKECGQSYSFSTSMYDQACDTGEGDHRAVNS